MAMQCDQNIVRFSGIKIFRNKHNVTLGRTIDLRLKFDVDRGLKAVGSVTGKTDECHKNSAEQGDGVHECIPAARGCEGLRHHNGSLDN